MSEKDEHKTDTNAPVEEDKGKNTVKAIAGLIRAVELAQTKGAYSFEESIEFYEHIKFFKQK